jgi:hypothetical protein
VSYQVQGVMVMGAVGGCGQKLGQQGPSRGRTGKNGRNAITHEDSRQRRDASSETGTGDVSGAAGPSLHCEQPTLQTF